MDTPQYRPAFHFTPQRWWMNDPNGLVVHDGVHHLYFQHHPHGMVWGPMHWGHATSRDLLHWQEHPIALAPDAKGMAFSGSVVIDRASVSGLGAGGRAPWLALYTQFDAEAGAAGRPNQHQGLAHSLDEGFTWTPFAANPVLPNPGLKDFRDPKVFHHAPSGRWLMVLAAGDHVQFHASTDLKAWSKLSEFGAGAGAHGSVWECPDLVELPLPGGRRRWVLIVSVVEGAPNGGSGTQYFVGDFDGTCFVPEHADLRWLDHGSDNYAGVTWHNSGERVLFIGWMSNWVYAREVPTAPWRGAMTLPRVLSLRQDGGATRLVQSLPEEVRAGFGPDGESEWALDRAPLDIGAAWAAAQGRLRLTLQAPRLDDCTLELSNDAGDLLRLGHDAAAGTWWLDRTRAGEVGFHPAFGSRQTLPRLGADAPADLTLVFDATSVECFADGGLSVLTALFFPRAPFTRAVLRTAAGMAGGRVALSPYRGAGA